ncbi:ThiF family protein [Desulfatibacillum alkenivorans DSM 16219]|uniref:ThiF family protein n=1 Tax=Desulfatibacillum alkenivorans DSM 16219 TaxID=1121393 RepID=A0A1M6N6G0_9BACT|nr:ThiF family protein [Desulfatibacillum alkenivorans DSM 16219]
MLQLESILTEIKMPETIRVGAHNAQAIPGVEFFDEPFLKQFKGASFWGFALRLQIGASSDIVPQTTEWFALIEDSYPFGDIWVYPSKANGIDVTFPHQDLNSFGNEKQPWRDGKLCLVSPVQGLGRIAGGKDPIGNYEERFRWHLSRAITWLGCAATNSLMQDGDPFETPYYACSSRRHIVHNESSATFHLWAPYNDGSLGIVVFHEVFKNDNRDLAVSFETMDGIPIRRTRPYSEENHGINSRHRRTGFWWLWKAPIVLPPWQAPTNWGELREIGDQQDIDVDQALRSIASLVRGEAATVLLIGYPMPLICGEGACEIYWQAIRLPRLESTKQAPKGGYLPTEKNFWGRDRRQAFMDQHKFAYLKTENWHPDRMQARGRFGSTMCKAKVALIGCGALGSIIAELLVREGVEDIMLIDGKHLSAHNLVRHTLYGDVIGKNKADALAECLSLSYPFTKIVSINNYLSSSSDQVESLLMDRKIVLDCTGCDEIIQILENVWWEMPKLFISSSVGYKAQRTFIFKAIRHQFPSEEFRRILEPILNEERNNWAENGETLEGPGCWSPLFPARLDDLLLSATSCIKVIEECLLQFRPDAKVVVFEQSFSNDMFTGLTRKECSLLSSMEGE